MNKKRSILRVLAPATGLLLAAALAGCQFPIAPDDGPSVGVTIERPAPGTPVSPQGMSTTDSLAFLEVVSAPALTAVPPAQPSGVLGTRILSTAFAPQVPPGSWSLTMSCGPASVNLAAARAWGTAPNQVTYIRAINRYLGKSDIDNCLPGGTSTSDLERAARAVNNCPNTYRASGWSLTRLRQEIDAGRPVVVAVRAGYLPNRGYSYTGGHFLLAVGYTDAAIVCHDVGTTYGAYKHYANGDFTRAMAYYGGAVVVVRR